MPGIKGVVETSFLDWPGRVCAVIFLGGCNLRCPFCHNRSLVLEPETLETYGLDEVLARLAPLRKWLGGICISGGEPTLDPGLPDLVRRLKKDNWPVKLDTNGTRPQVLANLLADGLLDMVAMDVKAPLEELKYSRCAGRPVDLEQIRASIGLLKESGIDHEFRMTIVPDLHSEGDVADWAGFLKNNGSSRLKLQNFSPRSTMNSDFSQKKSFAPEKFEKMQQMISCS